MKVTLVFGMLFLSGMSIGQHKSTWKLFSQATFADAYIEEFSAYASLLVYNQEMQALNGKKITITGYYIPVEEKVIIISKYPNANCFFCGEAGMESVMEVRPTDGSRTDFTTDQLLTYSGILSINHQQWEYVSFILKDAQLIDVK